MASGFLRRPIASLRPAHTLVTIGALVLVAGAVLCAYFIESLYESELSAIRNRLEIPAEAMAHITDTVTRNAGTALDNIRETLREPAADAAVRSQELRQMMVYRDGISRAINRIAIYDLAGRPILSSTPPSARPASVAGYDFFKRQLAARTDRLLISDLVRDPVDGSATIILSRRVLDAAGAMRGVAAVYLDAGYLQQTFDSLQMPAGATITAFNPDGHMVLRTPALSLGSPELAIDFSQGPFFKQFRDGDPAHEFARFRAVNGVDRFIAGIGSKDAPFVVAAGWDADVALATWRKETLGILGGAGLAAAIVMALLGSLLSQLRRNDKLLAQVSQSEMKLRDVVAALPDAVAIIDRTLCIEFANPAAEQLYGYGPGELNGCPLPDLMAWAVREQDKQGMLRAFDSPESRAILIERSVRRKDGREIPVEIASRRYASPAGPKLISVIRDASARRAQDLALRRSEEGLARAQKMAALGSFDRDLVTGAIECSNEFLRIWGFADPGTRPTAAALVELVHPEDRRKFIDSREAVLQGKPSPYPDFRIIRPDGSQRILHHEYNADFAADGKPIRLFGIVQDITDRKTIEMELRRNQETLARAQRIAMIGSFDRDLVAGRTEWSDEFLKVWGLDASARANLAAHPPADLLLPLVHPDDRDKFLEGRNAALARKPVQPLDFRVVRPDGAERILHREYGVVFDESGKPLRMFGTVQDITERKHIENELRRHREDLSRAQRIAGVGSFNRSFSSGATECSDELYRMHGIEPGSPEANTETLRSLIHPGDRAKTDEFRIQASQGVAPLAIDFRIVRRDGTERILHRECEVEFDENGNPLCLFGTTQDITELKKTENALRRSRENLSRAQRLAGIGSFERDLTTGEWTWSDQLYRIHGVEPGDPQADVKYLRSLVHPEDRARFDELRNLAERGIAAPPIDFRIVRPDGAERILHRQCDVALDEAGRPIRLIATLQDVTERRKAETELRRSRENLARAQHLAGVGSFERDIATGVIEWSDEMLRIFGFENAQVRPTQEVLNKLIHPDDRALWQRMRKEELAGKSPAPFEYRIIRPDGSERTVLRESAISFDKDGQPTRVFGTIQDITERKKTDAEILRSRENMARAQRIAAMGSFERDLITGRAEWSDEMYRILGVEPGDIEPGFEASLRFVHPEDRKRYTDNTRDIDTFVASPLEFRIVRPDGEERTVRRESAVVYDEAGKPIRLYGTWQDVTERRLAEARERDLERQLLHSQKLEALGTLAGGIAHDLNNTLVPIMALSKLTAKRFEPGSLVRANLDTIHEASERARDLVRRVLAFSRKEEPEQQEADLAAVAREALKLLRATVPTSIQFDADLAEVPPIRADASQLHQVITNLVSNAAGAIGNGMGVISVSLVVAPAKGRRELRLSVSDTGDGMDEATLHRIFEPFFTTKPVGQGTGLGLSIVHGIVTGHGGRIDVQSARGKGTRFDLYFPVPEAAPAARPITSSRPAA